MDSVIAGYYQMVAFILFTLGPVFGTYILSFLSSGKSSICLGNITYHYLIPHKFCLESERLSENK